MADDTLEYIVMNELLRILSSKAMRSTLHMKIV